MDHIVKKLSEIEHAAEAVVEHAELEKSELEERIQNERNQFDKQLEDHTQKELNDIYHASLQLQGTIYCLSHFRVLIKKSSGQSGLLHQFGNSHFILFFDHFLDREFCPLNLLHALVMVYFQHLVIFAHTLSPILPDSPGSSGSSLL